MAHKTLVNSTEYEIAGGVTLVSGTSYSVKNGKVLIGGAAYDISFILPATVLDLWSGTDSRLNCLTYTNGYWVVGGRGYDGNNYCARIAYATSLDGVWTIKDFWGCNTNDNEINCVTYANGYWVVGGVYRTSSSSSSFYASLAYATSLTGAWSTKDLWVRSVGTKVTSLTYADGYWVVGGNSYNSYTNHASIAYATSPGGTWTTIDLWTGSGAEIKCLTYADGYWVVGGIYQASGTTTYYARIAYATSLTGTWSTIDLLSNGNSIFNCLTYADGNWVLGGSYYDGSAWYARIAYGESLKSFEAI